MCELNNFKLKQTVESYSFVGRYLFLPRIRRYESGSEESVAYPLRITLLCFLGNDYPVYVSVLFTLNMWQLLVLCVVINIKENICNYMAQSIKSYQNLYNSKE